MTEQQAMGRFILFEGPANVEEHSRRAPPKPPLRGGRSVPTTSLSRQLGRLTGPSGLRAAPQIGGAGANPFPCGYVANKPSVEDALDESWEAIASTTRRLTEERDLPCSGSAR